MLAKDMSLTMMQMKNPEPHLTRMTPERKMSPLAFCGNRLEGKSHRGKTTGAKNKQKAAEGVRKTSKKSKKHGRLPSVLASKDMESLIDVTNHKSKSKSSKKLFKGHEIGRAHV